MANNVFANGLEIACKAADGKAIAAFPDPCFTPPSPPAGWVPVPYPNTAYAKDTANASKTVMISGKPVMKKDVSYFKTSTGNEAAAGPKGVVSGVKKGKAYFTSWSMNVKVEGKNVDRHTDMTTHNHGSKMGNTGVWKYIDEKDTQEGGACENEFKEVEDKCSKDTGGNPLSKGESWKEKHCEGLKGNKPTNKKNSDKHAEKAAENDCLKARKCMLVPMNDTYHDPSDTSSWRNSGGKDTIRGCCSAQTGHHVMPDAWFTETGKRGVKSSDVCPGGYNEHEAPVVCAEGKYHSVGGSHKKMHDNTDIFAQDVKDNFNYGNARDAAVKAHTKTFGNCNPACIRAQLNNQYKEKWECHLGADLKAVSSKNGSALPSSSDDLLPN